MYTHISLWKHSFLILHRNLFCDFLLAYFQSTYKDCFLTKGNCLVNFISPAISITCINRNIVGYFRTIVILERIFHVKVNFSKVLTVYITYVNQSTAAYFLIIVVLLERIFHGKVNFFKLLTV